MRNNEYNSFPWWNRCLVLIACVPCFDAMLMHLLLYERLSCTKTVFYMYTIYHCIASVPPNFECPYSGNSSVREGFVTNFGSRYVVSY